MKRSDPHVVSNLLEAISCLSDSMAFDEEFYG